ncbi:MAG: RNA polymerase factor sigma-54 [Verrucomicrobia bacterium]|nr:RNA polymerase factor sigma-54 [Verrucomicrobiota bacterium]
MAQGLHLSQKMSLQQVLAPQLQQSLALLQAPILELKAMVEQELQQNPVLEEATVAELSQEAKRESGEGGEPDYADPTEPPADVTFDPATDRPSAVADDFQAEFERLAQLDQEWRDYFAQTNVPMRGSDEEEERRQYMFDSIVASTSLQQNLLEQVRMSDLTPDQYPVAEMIVGNIDDRGYLQASIDELAFSTNIPADRILAVLQVIQGFHPPGVGARDLRECLLLQLERAGRQPTVEYTIVRDHMEALGKRRFPEIARALGLAVEEAQQAAERISHLEPRPGRDFMSDDHLYVVPEVFVQRVGAEYTVTTNNDAVPHLRISNTYKDLMAQPDSSTEVREYIRDKIRAGKFLIKSLHQRQSTILNIARELVNRQRDFMDKGVAQLKPMTMSQVAEVVGVHETTVSRAVAGKYIETPQGVFEMKYFFTSGIPTASGVGMSNESVKGIISDLVAQEEKAKPLSDEEIVKRLSEKGIMIARRTVAKYRTELNILPSHLRKVY